MISYASPKIFSIKQEVETFLNQSWQINRRKLIKDLKDMANEMYNFLSHDHQKLYEFFTYLRHFGFPSPLIDWSRSPYIAAYFAFRQKHVKPPENVSIYVFLEYPKGEKLINGWPLLGGLSQYQKTHPRHFLQQCEYTVCVNLIESNPSREYYFFSHQDYFSFYQTGDQDLLWKFNIPYSERKKVLHFLDQVNINSFSLFQTGEGLMETMALRHFS